MAKLFNNIVDLPLSTYIECKVDRNLEALIITGEATKEELEFAWNEIEQEYADAVGDMEHFVYIKVLKEVTILSTDLKIIGSCIQLLSQCHVPRFGEELNKLLHTTFKFDPSNQEQYLRELQSCANRSKELKMRLKLKEIEFDAIKEKHEGHSVEPTREYFHRILNQLEEHFHVPVDPSITVYRFCDKLRRYNKYAELRIKEAKKQKGKEK